MWPEDLRTDLSLTAVDGFPVARLQGSEDMVSEGVLGSSEAFHRLAARMPAISRFGGWVADKGLISAGAAALGTVVVVSVAAVAARSGVDVSSLVPSGVSALGAFVADIRGYDPGNVLGDVVQDGVRGTIMGLAGGAGGLMLKHSPQATGPIAGTTAKRFAEGADPYAEALDGRLTPSEAGGVEDVKQLVARLERMMPEVDQEDFLARFLEALGRVEEVLSTTSDAFQIDYLIYAVHEQLEMIERSVASELQCQRSKQERQQRAAALQGAEGPA